MRKIRLVVVALALVIFSTTTAKPAEASIYDYFAVSATIRDFICWYVVCGSSAGGCDDEFGCGSNSPVVDGAVIQELDEPGKPAAGTAGPGSIHASSLTLRDILFWLLAFDEPVPSGGEERS
jgi:hypothetical protein